MPNVSQEKREYFAREIARLRESCDLDEQARSCLAEIENRILQQSFGLSWETHTEEVDQAMSTSIPVFSERTADAIDSDRDRPLNFLLEGDNLHCLKLLNKTHRNGIDVIYIDPPYNTQKSGFTYNDKLVDDTDGYRHSKWLSFMSRRLKEARPLLTPKGVVFISVDNAELYHLKLLCDQIFGENNFVGNIVWRTTTDNNVSQITTEHDYILCYARNKAALDKWTAHSELADELQHQYEKLRATHGADNQTIQSELRSWLKTQRARDARFDELKHYDNVDDRGVFHDGDIANTVDGGYRYPVIHPVTGKECVIPVKGYRYREDTMREMLRREDILFGPDETTLIKPKQRLENYKEKLKAYYYEDGRAATKSLEKIFGEKGRFSNPKSVRLLSRLIDFAGGKDAVVLDFFAGSGSTGEAVMALNAKDGGNRRFILCTNNEISAINTLRYLHDNGHMLDYKPSPRAKSQGIWNKIEKWKTAHPEEYQTLFETADGKERYAAYGICRFVTYPRLKAVITGQREDGTQLSEGYKENLRYYRSGFVPRESDDLGEQLLDHTAEMIQLEIAEPVDGECNAMITSDAEADRLEQSTADITGLNHIYIARSVLLTDSQREAFEKVQLREIPEWYFRFELAEAGDL